MSQPSVRTVDVQGAKELVDQGHTYLDVRTPEEFQAGHPDGAINIPYLLAQPGGRAKNPDFMKDTKDRFGPETKLVVGCQGGGRSMLAAGEMLQEKFTDVANVGGGFQAWQQSGLPVVK